jgi:hypothetical protein
VRSGGHEDHSFAVGNRARGKATHRTIEKLLILIELNDVIARAGGA